MGELGCKHNRLKACDICLRGDGQLMVPLIEVYDPPLATGNTNIVIEIYEARIKTLLGLLKRVEFVAAGRDAEIMCLICEYRGGTEHTPNCELTKELNA